MKNMTLAVFAALILAGCSQFSNEIVPIHHATRTYSEYSCNQLELEAKRVARELSVYATEQDKLANRDATLAVASIFIVTAPASLMMTGGNGPIADEVADLRGQVIAMEKVGIQKNCKIQFDSF